MAKSPKSLNTQQSPPDYFGYEELVKYLREDPRFFNWFNKIFGLYVPCHKGLLPKYHYRWAVALLREHISGLPQDEKDKILAPIPPDLQKYITPLFGTPNKDKPGPKPKGIGTGSYLHFMSMPLAYQFLSAANAVYAYVCKLHPWAIIKKEMDLAHEGEDRRYTEDVRRKMQKRRLKAEKNRVTKVVSEHKAAQRIPEIEDDELHPHVKKALADVTRTVLWSYFSSSKPLGRKHADYKIPLIRVLSRFRNKLIPKNVQYTLKTAYGYWSEDMDRLKRIIEAAKDVDARTHYDEDS